MFVINLLIARALKGAGDIGHGLPTVQRISWSQGDDFWKECSHTPASGL
jgi:hypothetical protein